MKGLTRDTYREMKSHHGFIIFGFVTVIACGLAMLSRYSHIRMQTGPEAIEELQFDPFLSFMDGFIDVLVFLAVMVSSGVVPRLLEKGRADFYLSKPITRQSLVLSKITSIWLVYGSLLLAASLLVAGVLAVSLGSGAYSLSLLLFSGLFQLAVWTSISSLIAVLTASQSVTVTALFGIWLAQLLLGLRESFAQVLTIDWPKYLLDVLYYLFPKTSEIDMIFSRLAAGEKIAGWQPVGTTVIICGLCVLASVALFRRKDY